MVKVSKATSKLSATLKHAVDKEVKKVVKKIKKVEMNHIDVSLGGNVTSAGVLDGISFIAQGDDYFNRTGIQLIPSLLEYRGELVPASASASPVLARLIIFQDMEQRGVIPTIAEVLQTASPMAFYNYLNLKRFKILVDIYKDMQLGGWLTYTSAVPNAVVTQQQIGIKIKGKKKMGGIIRYSGTTTAQADQKEGNIYCLRLTDTLGNSFLNINTRFWFNKNT